MKALIVYALIVLVASTAIVLDVQSWQNRRQPARQPLVIQLGPGCGNTSPALADSLASAR